MPGERAAAPSGVTPERAGRERPRAGRDGSLPGGLQPGGLAAWRAFLTAHAAAIERIERDLAAQGDLLPLTWYDVLLELHAAPQHRLRQSDLLRAVVLTRSGISRLVDRLEAAGLVCRQPNPDDRRGDLVVLTEAGRAALRRTWPAYARGIQEHFARHLTAAEAATLAAALERVRQAGA
ncbi:MAG TPA: MarR family transcriptional regulator [Chloroflexota bacterium]|nr:MarR family transcriptional regulator [Chloroflexota bacterium]